MKTRLVNIWDDFRSSFWFVPIVMGLLAIFLAVVTVTIDRVAESQIEQWLPWLVMTPSSARSTLTAISSATITLVCVVFSITIVTVTMASSQYGSRLLRAYMTDSIADRVMGAFVGTSLYCLIILRFIREKPDTTDPFVPQLSTAVAMSLGLISVVLLIWFVHHVSISIQAPKIISGVARDLDSAIDRLFPAQIESLEADESHLNQVRIDASAFPPVTVILRGDADGYVEAIDLDSLANAASGAEGIIELNCRPGKFLSAGAIIARFRSESEPTPEKREELGRLVPTALILGSRRTPRYDVSCSIYELVEIAVRALSPGVNDPFTAMNCIDRIGAALGRLSQRKNLSRYRVDEEHNVRLITIPKMFVDVLHDGYRQIRQYGTSSVAVSIRLIESLMNIAEHALRYEDLCVIQEEAKRVRTAFVRHDPLESDLADFQARYDELEEILAAARENPDAGTYREPRLPD